MIQTEYEQRQSRFTGIILLCIQSLLLALQPFYALGSRKVLRHCSANITDSLSHFRADFFMYSIGVVLPFDFILAQDIFCLCGTKEISGQLRASHMVKNILRLFETLALMDIFSVKSPIKTFISLVLEYRIVKRSFYSGIVGSSSKLSIVFPHFITQEQALLFFLGKRRIGIEKKLSSAGLYRKIGLCLSHNRFGRTRILHCQITCVAAHKDGNYLSFSVRANLNHFGLYHEMVIRVYTAVCARPICASCDFFKCPVIRVFQNFRQFSGRPVFMPLLIYSLDALESLLGFLGESCTHNILSNNHPRPSTAICGAWQSPDGDDVKSSIS